MAGAKARRRGGGIRHRGVPASQEEPSESVAEREEHEDHERDDDRDGGDHREARDGPSSFTACSAARRPRAAAGRRSGRSSRWRGRRRRARRRARACSSAWRGSGDGARRRPAELAAQRLQRARRQRARVGAARCRRPRRTAAAARAASRRRPCRRGSRCRPPAAGRRAKPRSASASAAMPARVVRAVEDRCPARESTTSKRPGTSVEAAAAATMPSSSAPEVGLGRRAREREVAPLVGAAREHLEGGRQRVDRRDRQPRAALRARVARQRQRVGMQVGADDEGAVRPHDVELLARDVGDRGPEPARVLEADVGQHLHARRDDVRRVVAPAEPGLDDGDLHAGARRARRRRRRSAPRTA